MAPDPFDQLDDAAPNAPLRPAESRPTSGLAPLYISMAQNINDYGRFADGGSDSNWYVGFNNAWIVELPPAPEAAYQRAFIGAKIGRAKSVPKKQRPWERVRIPGKVYIAVSQRPAFSAEQSFFLAETRDIPLEPDSSIYMPGTGNSEWFWAEVPVNLVSTRDSNYLIVWSPTREFRDAERSPILAARAPAKGTNGGTRAWNNHNLQGVPPRNEDGTLQTPINLQPAMAIKLIRSEGGPVSVADFSIESADTSVIASFSVAGRDVDFAWIEMSQDELEWGRMTAFRRAPPYIFTVPRADLPPQGAYLRARARTAAAGEGASGNVFVYGVGQ